MYEYLITLFNGWFYNYLKNTSAAFNDLGPMDSFDLKDSSFEISAQIYAIRNTISLLSVGICLTSNLLKKEVKSPLKHIQFISFF
jgi:hypothetical protein